MWIIVEYINDGGAVYNIGLATTNAKLLVFLRQYAACSTGSSGGFKEVPGMMCEDLPHVHKRMLPMMTGAKSDIYAQWMDPDA